MGLLNLIRKQLKKTEKEVRILVLGLDNSGKTTILKSLSNKDISQIAPTHGFNIKNLSHDGFRLNVWDVGGQKALREYWANYFDHTDALVFVVDSSDEKRLDESRQELSKLLQEDALQQVPLLIYANKQDLIQALSTDQINEHLKLDDIKQRQQSIMACSAKTQEGLQEGMEWLMTSIKKMSSLQYSSSNSIFIFDMLLNRSQLKIKITKIWLKYQTHNIIGNYKLIFNIRLMISK